MATQTIGLTPGVRFHASLFNNPVAWSTLLQSPGGSSFAAYRFGDPARMRELAGKVIRGWYAELRTQYMLRINSEYASYPFPPRAHLFDGYTDADVSTSISTSGEADYRERAVWYRPSQRLFEQADTSIPLGWFPDAAYFAQYPSNSPNAPPGQPTNPESLLAPASWLGVQTTPILGVDKPALRVAALNVIVSDKAKVTIEYDGSTPLPIDVTRTLRVRVAYPDGEAVHGLRIHCAGSSQASVAPSSAVTNTDGEVVFTVRGVQGGTASLSFALDPARQYTQHYCYEPNFPLTHSVEVQGNPEPPQPGQCVTYPAVEAVPGRPSTVTREPSREWNSGANSVQEIGGDAVLRFVQPHAVGAVLGFVQSRDDVGSYSRMTHAFYFHYSDAGTPVYQVMESGRLMTEPAHHDRTVEFRIERAGESVHYYVDDVRVLSSPTPSAGVLIAGCALYSTGDKVPNADIGDGP